MADVIDIPLQVIPRRSRRLRDADQSIAEDPNSVADSAVNEIRRGLDQGGANAALDRVAVEGGIAPASRSADDAMVQPPETPDPSDRPIADPGNENLGPSRPTGLVDRDRVDHHDFTTGNPIDDSNIVDPWQGPEPRAHVDADRGVNERAPSGKPSAPVVDAADRPIAESPANKPRQDTLDRDRAELEHAERGHRVRNGLRIFGNILSTALTMAGAAVPGLAAVGQVVRAASDSGDPDAPLERAQRSIALRHEAEDRDAAAAQRDEAEADKDARLAFDREQAIVQGKRADRAAGINEENMLSGQRNATARIMEQNRMNALTEDEQRSHLDPAHQNAANLRPVFVSSLEALSRRNPTLREDFSDTLEALPTMNADQIGSALEEMRLVANSGGRRGRTGSGSGGGVSLAPVDRAALLQDYAEMTGADIDEAARRFSDTRRGNEQLQAEVRTMGRPRAGGRGVAGVPANQSLVPGWVPIEGAPPLNANQADKARETVATFETISTMVARMKRLANEVNAAQAAGARAGVVSAQLARAAQIQEQISNALRTIGGYGVPNGTELERMEALAPRLTTVDGFINAQPVYDALLRTMWDKTRIVMRSQYGYQRPPRQPAGEAQ